MFNIVSESMEPTFYKDDLAIVKSCNAEELEKGDIITFEQEDRVISHRISDIIKEKGDEQFITKGDNNEVEDKEPVNDLSLLNNSLEINVNGNTQLSNTYNQIYSILEVNFFDDHIKFSGKNIFDKEDFNIPDEDYIVIKQFKDLGIYAGNYYIPTLDDKGNVKTKNYTILIDKSGNIYGYKGMTNVGMTFTLEGNVLKSEHNNNGDKIIMSYKLEQDRIVYQINFIYGSEYSYELMKSDLFTPYMGTYSAGNITLQVNENNASINTATTGNYYSSIINGNNLVISEILFENDTDPIEIKEHKITFSDDKTKATYTKPDGTTVELIKK